jgi:predicted amidophosphoribosyltransferase
MLRVIINTRSGSFNQEKTMRCEFCGEEVSFFFNPYFTCKKCFEPLTKANRLIDKRSNSSDMAYAIKWHFAKKGMSIW